MKPLVLWIVIVACSTTPPPAPPPAHTVDAAIGDAAPFSAPDAATTPIPESKPAGRVYAKTTPRGTLQSDLLSAPCEPGAICETRVMLPAGMHLIGSVTLDGGTPNTPSPFVLTGSAEIPHDEETELVVTAKNRGSVAARLRGLFQYGPTSAHPVAVHVRVGK